MEEAVKTQSREWPPQDRNIEPRFILVYVAKEPATVYRIARTHARSFEEMDHLVKFARDNEITAEDLIGAWELGQRLQLERTATQVVETKTVHEWRAPEGN